MEVVVERATLPSLCDVLAGMHRGVESRAHGDVARVTVVGRGSLDEPEAVVVLRLSSAVAALFGAASGARRWCRGCGDGPDGCGMCGYDCLVLLAAVVHPALRRTGVLTSLLGTLRAACGMFWMQRGVIVSLALAGGQPQLLDALQRRCTHTLQLGRDVRRRFAVFPALDPPGPRRAAGAAD